MIHGVRHGSIVPVGRSSSPAHQPEYRIVNSAYDMRQVPILKLKEVVSALRWGWVRVLQLIGNLYEETTIVGEDVMVVQKKGK